VVFVEDSESMKTYVVLVSMF